jgi:hypothetical protein
MKYKAIPFLLAAALAGGSFQVLADDANSAPPVMNHKQLMRDCVAKEKAANSSASDEDVKKTCNAKIKAHRDHPSETKAPADTPPG